jgi:hypothetical protein
MSKEIKRGVYRHYKGNPYKVLGVAMHSETAEKMVIYQALYDCPDLEDEYGARPYFVRPYNLFLETVKINGKEVPRFKYIKA